MWLRYYNDLIFYQKHRTKSTNKYLLRITNRRRTILLNIEHRGLI